MKQIIENIGQKDCLIYTDELPQVLLIQPLGKHESEHFEEELEFIQKTTEIPFAMCAFIIDDWETELTPWYEPMISRRKDVTPQGNETLLFLTDVLLPLLNQRFGNLPVILGGYSLAGLFSLWAGYERNSFDAVAGVSPSVWITNWKDYMLSHSIQAKLVYLSLGDREELSRNQKFAQVGEIIRIEHKQLSSQLDSEQCILEWNPGNHFMDNEQRTARGFAWCMERISKNGR